MIAILDSLYIVARESVIAVGMFKVAPIITHPPAGGNERGEEYLRSIQEMQRAACVHD